MRTLGYILLAATSTLGAWAPARAGDPSPFDALRAGRVRSGACFRPAAEGEPAPPLLRVSVPGRGSAPVGPTGAYSFEGATSGIPQRVFATPVCGSGERATASGIGILGDLNGFELGLDVPGAGAPTSDLRVTGPGGTRTIVIPRLGAGSQISVTATAGGSQTPLIGSPALVLASSNAAVAGVNPAGGVSSIAPGLARIEAAADGEWAAVIVSVDETADTDGDGMPDSYETAHGLDPSNPADAGLDPDLDGLTNLDESRRRTNPRSADTDGDTLSDQTEVQLRNTDPTSADSDGDTFNDGQEITQGTDPLNPNEKPGPAFTPALKNNVGIEAAAIRASVVVNDFVYIVAADGQISSYKIELPPTYFILFRDELLLSPDLRDVAVEGTTAYVAGGPAGLHVVDIANPSILVRTSTIGSLGTVNGVVVRSGIVYLATDIGLRILKPRAGGGFDNAGSFAISSFSRLAVSGSHAFLGIPGTNRLISVDISDPNFPRERQRFAMPAATLPFRAIDATGPFVYVAHGSAGVVALSAADPSNLQIIDTTGTEFPSASFDAVAVLGNRLAAHTGSVNARAQLYRIRDDGRIERTGEVDSSPLGATQLLLNQSYLLGISGATLVLSEVLAKGDRAGAAPTGSLFTETLDQAFAPGDEVPLGALARDDVYVESVDFQLDGRPALHDSPPPFRFRPRMDPALPAPRLMEVRAFGLDLQRNQGALGGVLLSIEPDLDSDGIPDSPDPDADGDGVGDLEETYPGSDGFVSDPASDDTDGDGIPDGEEFAPGADTYVTDPGSRDSDRDGLDDPYEIGVIGSDPSRADSDGDGVADGLEDLDGDGLVNREEALLGSNPTRSDTDGDGLGDGLERDLGLDPTRRDSDGDGIDDDDEDFDGDGLSNGGELARGTDPRRADTDGDGFDDATEVDIGTSPTVATDFSTRMLSFQSKTVVIRAPIRVGSLTLTGSTLTVPAAAGSSVLPLDVIVTGLLTIDAASSIDVSGKGYPGGRGVGNALHVGLGPRGPAHGSDLAGGSHGAEGGGDASGLGQPAAVHGSIRSPDLAGGGGSAGAAGTARGGNGGGALRIRANGIQLAGAITAAGDAAPAPGGGGGAGGSIWIECATLQGGGRIEAGGGAAQSGGGASPGGGGGGRIAIHYGSAPAFNFTRVTARGGALAGGGAESAGGAGTVFLRAGGGLGELVIDNGGVTQAEPRTVLAGIGEGTVADLGDDYLVKLEGDFPEAPAGLELDPDADDSELDVVQVLAADGDRITTPPGLLGRTGVGARFAGVFRFEKLTVRAGGALRSDALLALASKSAPIQLDSGEVEAPGILLLQATGFSASDSRISLGTLEGPGGGLSTLTLTDSEAEFDSGIDSGTIVLDGSVLSAGGAVTAGAVTLKASVLTVPDPEGPEHRVLDLTVDGKLTIDAGSRIDLVGKGRPGGYRNGNASPSGLTPDGDAAGGPGGGGGGGGGGGVGTAGGAAQSGAGDLLAPALPGGGGSTEPAGDPETAEHLGGNGGGVANIIAGEIVLDGVVDASGEGAEHPELFTSPRSGGGAGGSILIAVTTLRGTGSIVAAGGSAASAGGLQGGGGGGGRISVIHGSRTGFTGSFRAPGGQVIPGPAIPTAVGGAGTIHLKAASAPRGDLILDGEGRIPDRHRTTIPADPAPLECERVIVRGGARLESARALRVHALDSGKFLLEGFLKTTRLELPPVATVEISGGELDAGEVVSSGTGIGVFLARSSKVLLGSVLSARDLQLTNGSVLTVPDPTFSETTALLLDLGGTLFIDPSSAIDVDGKGYVGGARGGNPARTGQAVDGASFSSGGRTGGSHGGLGGVQAAGTGLGTSIQPVHDDFTDPRRAGGGGSAKLDIAELGYNGGGLIRIEAMEALISGRITADGDGRQRPGSTDLGGAGAGGGILIVVETLIGAGEITADGGFADAVVGGGAGGGGRIAIYYDDRSVFTGAVHAFGGGLVPETARNASIGGAGTVFWKQTAQLFGDLVIDNANRTQSSPRTQLRPVGVGTISALTATTLQSPGPFPTSDTGLQGQYALINGNTLRPFLIVSNTGTVITTDPASGDMRTAGGTGDAHSGAIVLDNLLVTRRAAFTTRGDFIIIATGAATTSDNGSITAPPILHW